MGFFSLSYSDNEDGNTTSMTFHADKVSDVLERITVFLASGPFPYVTDVVAMSEDEGGDDNEDVYFYSDGTRLTGRQIDAANRE
jgi:hypothetical protein